MANTVSAPCTDGLPAVDVAANLAAVAAEVQEAARATQGATRPRLR